MYSFDSTLDLEWNLSWGLKSSERIGISWGTNPVAVNYSEVSVLEVSNEELCNISINGWSNSHSEAVSVCDCSGNIGNISTSNSWWNIEINLEGRSDSDGLLAITETFRTIWWSWDLEIAWKITKFKGDLNLEDCATGWLGELKVVSIVDGLCLVFIIECLVVSWES